MCILFSKHPTAVLPGDKMLNACLWLAQLFLAFLSGWTGILLLTMTTAQLMLHGFQYAFDLPSWLVKFIGLSDLCGAAGLILPGVTRIAPWLIPAAATGLLALQTCAIFFNIMQHAFYHYILLHLVLMLPAMFIAWGREDKLPIPSRHAQ